MKENLIEKEKKYLEKYLPSLPEEYHEIVDEILNHPEFLKRLYYKHHEDISVYIHCLKVSYRSYQKAIKKKQDYKSAAIAGLLHDFYNEDWHKSTYKPKNFFDHHGFRHPKEALINARKYFPHLMNEKIEDAILKHMFPLTIKLPKYRVSWIVSWSDKMVSMTIFKNPSKLLTYIGIGSKEKG